MSKVKTENLEIMDLKYEDLPKDLIKELVITRVELNPPNYYDYPSLEEFFNWIKYKWLSAKDDKYVKIPKGIDKLFNDIITKNKEIK